jgi:hypothetical protein
LDFESDIREILRATIGFMNQHWLSKAFHSTFSPGIELSGFSLSEKMKTELTGMAFEDENELLINVSAY